MKQITNILSIVGLGIALFVGVVYISDKNIHSDFRSKASENKTPDMNCQTGSWKTGCFTAGKQWCAAGKKCDTGWIDGPEVGVTCPAGSVFLNIGTYCTRTDGKVNFKGSGACIRDTKCIKK
jgi:hypothetical protein